MECNKEESVRAKRIAEEKMRKNDFVGARRIAKKAQQLFPEIENIQQLVTVCEVHCSAQNKPNGSDNDWYGILQIEQSADEAAIKKQYRKLALLLHPDKNKFAGAEAAFKLIGEANRILSDQAQRSLYDSKCRVFAKSAAPKPPPPEANKNSSDSKQNGTTNTFKNVPKSGSHPQQQVRQQTFWTCCPFCTIRYEYYLQFACKVLRCQNCQQLFVANDLGHQAAPPKSQRGQFPNKKVAPKPGISKVASQNAGANPSSSTKLQDKFSGSDPVSEGGGTAEVSRSIDNNKKDHGHNGVRGGNIEVGKSESDVMKKPGKSAASANVDRKRSRKSMTESDGSDETEITDDTDVDAVTQGNGCQPAENGGCQPRRSSRNKNNVTYAENLSDDDFVSPRKRSRGSVVFKTSEKEKIEVPGDCGESSDAKSASSVPSADGHKEEVKQNAPYNESVLYEKDKVSECKAEWEEAAMPDHSDEKSNLRVDLKLNKIISETVKQEYPDPEFSDFDKDRAEDCFAVDQIWAVYDTVDGMPRFYVRIRKVFSPGFKVRITWLESNPDDQLESYWCDEDLPVACGTFKHGVSEETVDRLIFSHQMECARGGARGSSLMYPRKGEIWALFRDWDINWFADPEKHMPFKYEFVEVLKDLEEDDVITVAYLHKLKGFVCLFQRIDQLMSSQIPTCELLRFSHRIPASRMTGTEREDVPEGSFELDPMSLPAKVLEFGHVKMDDVNMNSEVNGSFPKHPENNVKSTMRLSTPEKKEKDLEKETPKLRKSPRGLKSTCNGNQVNKSPCTVQGDAEKNSKIGNGKSHGQFTQPKESASSCQADDWRHTPKKQKNNDLERETLDLRRSPRDLSKTKSQVNSNKCMTVEEIEKNPKATEGKNSGSFPQCDEKVHLNTTNRNSSNLTESPMLPSPFSSGCKTQLECHDFYGDKLEENFQLDQIWALCSGRNGLPKRYAQVKKIEFSPTFRLHVTFLEPCSLPKGMNQLISCGTFKVKTGKTWEFPRSAFSHRLTVEPMGNDIYEIYPRKGEVWAIYKNWNCKLTCSELLKGERDIVEIIEDNDQCIKVAILARVHGFKSIFKVPRSQRSKTAFLDVLQVEVARFSHQIPAFKHTGEKDACLRDCWELDPLSIPGNVICLD